jgi:pimeloyl-ACP methyl ester carboxylesterase
MVIALHCSGASGAMWRGLADQLTGTAHVMAPALYGAVDGPVWPGDRAFTLADEAAPVIAMMDDADRPVHLVGHSYGGAVALHAALARPRRVASLTLYEPACFQLLQPADGIDYAEIQWLAKNVAAMMARGDARGAMKRFVDYWNGRGSWEALSVDAQAALLRWAPKAPLDFHALLERPVHSAAYDQLEMPCHIFVGAQSPSPTVEIANILCAAMPACHQTLVEGAGHMGPITHAGDVAARMAAHVRSVLPGDAAGSKASADRAA